jgi:hypothetical protein
MTMRDCRDIASEDVDRRPCIAAQIITACCAIHGLLQVVNALLHRHQRQQSLHLAAGLQPEVRKYEFI